MTSEGRHLSRAGQCSVNKRKFLITYTKLQNERKKRLILESEKAGQCSVNEPKFLITYTKLQNERKKMLILESEKAKLKEPLINKKNENLRE